MDQCTHLVFSALVHTDRVSAEEWSSTLVPPHEITHEADKSSPVRAMIHFNIRYVCSTSEQTMGFCIQAGEIAIVLLYGADMQPSSPSLLDRDVHLNPVLVCLTRSPPCRVDRWDHSHPSFHLHVAEIQHISESPCIPFGGKVLITLQ